MKPDLKIEELRILGALMEKEMATPDYYPLTLNSLTSACNQKSNRNPVVSFDEATITDALESLIEKRLVRRSSLSRALKYEQIFTESLNMIQREAAIICVLLLRGPQTIGELRGRSERLFSFENLDQVRETLTNLEDMELIRQLPKQPGRKENRIMHLLADEETTEQIATSGDQPVAMVVQSASADRLEELEKQVQELQEAFTSLQSEFETFKSQFD